MTFLDNFYLKGPKEFFSIKISLFNDSLICFGPEFSSRSPDFYNHSGSSSTLRVLRPSPSPRGTFGLIAERILYSEKMHLHKPGHRAWVGSSQTMKSLDALQGSLESPGLSLLVAISIHFSYIHSFIHSDNKHLLSSFNDLGTTLNMTMSPIWRTSVKRCFRKVKLWISTMKYKIITSKILFNLLTYELTRNIIHLILMKTGLLKIYNF